MAKGSDSTQDIDKEFHPLLITNQSINKKEIAATDVYSVIWESVLGVS